MNIENSKKITQTPTSKSTTPLTTVDATSDIGRMRMEDAVLAAAAAFRDVEMQKLAKEKTQLEAFDKNISDQIKELTNVINKL